MVELAIAFIFVAILAILSLRANKRFRDVDRLPMQWSLGGGVNWTAPRPLALAFTPLLAAVILIAAAVSVMFSGDPRSGQEGLGGPVVFLLGLVFLAVHLLHLRLMARSVDKAP